ncbi:probable methyltransferase [Tanacetum coccineum]
MVSFDVLVAKAPCNFLIFGLGYDSLMWAAFNPKGKTLFLEEDPLWVRSILKTAPNLNVGIVNYQTKLEDADKLMKSYRSKPECAKGYIQGNTRCKLAITSLPEEVYANEWDVIMIDAPRGYYKEAPGRMGAIYSAAVMARNRKKPGNLKKAVRRLWHFEIPPAENVTTENVSDADGYDNADVMMAMSVEELLDWTMDSGSSYYITYRRDYLVDFKEYDGDNILLGDGREFRVRGTSKVQVQMRDGSSFMLDNVRQDQVTRNTLKGRKQLGEYQTGWKIKMGNVLDFFCNQGSTQQCTKGGVAKYLGVAVIQQGYNHVYISSEQGHHHQRLKTPIDMLEFFVWLASIKQGDACERQGQVHISWERKGIVGNKLWRLDDVTSKVVLYRNMGFNESGEYKKTFIGSGVGTGLMQVLRGFEFKVISKWKTGLKDDMDARSDVYVLSNGYGNGFFLSMQVLDLDYQGFAVKSKREINLVMEIIHGLEW